MEATRYNAPRWHSVVIQDGKVYRMGDPRHPVQVYPLAERLLIDPAALLDITAATGHAPEITIVVDRVPLPDLYHRPPVTPTECLAEFAKRAGVGGWKASAAALELGSGWITWIKDKHTPVVHMAIRNMLPEPDAAGGDLIMPEDTPEQIAERLVRFARLMFAAYRANPGISALGALRNLYDRPLLTRKPGGPARFVVRPEPKFIWHGAPADVSGAGDLIWRRNPTTAERAMPYVQAFDTRAAYLAAAAGAKLGWHEPKHTGAITWDPDQSGLYRIRVRGMEWADARRGVPIVSPARINSDGTTWVAGPILALLSELELPMPEIIDSWTCQGVGGRDIRADITGRYLSDWSDRIRDALPDANTAGDPVLRTAIKRTYSRGVGSLARAGGRVYRRDWHATIQDEARTRLLRRIYNHHAHTGAWPLRVKTDCVWYAEHTADPAVFTSTLSVGPRIGQLRHEPELSGTMADYMDMDRRQAAARRAKRQRQGQ